MHERRQTIGPDAGLHRQIEAGAAHDERAPSPRDPLVVLRRAEEEVRLAARAHVERRLRMARARALGAVVDCVRVEGALETNALRRRRTGG